MKELLRQLAYYNVWAYQRILETALLLPEESLTAQVNSSFESIQRTILHLWDAESIWWQRMKLQEHVMRPSEHFHGTTQDAVDGLLSQAKLWQSYLDGVSEPILTHVFEYRNNKREQVKLPVYQMMMHLFNHDTYHRGQLVTLLRQAGATKLPSTDFVAWRLSKNYR